MCATSGTSPRTRGKPQCVLNLFIGHRNIPAYAGKTPVLSSQPDTYQEHPRVRGENSRIASGACPGWGTSPRTRGKLDRLAESVAANRNIPAYAGKTTCQSSDFTTVKEHPRVRGENSAENCRKKSLGGTSPRTRGKRYGAPDAFTTFRNIPAYAGKTYRFRPRRR